MRLTLGGDEFFCDLLFYHLRLRRYVVVELKAVPFQAEFVGKLGMYLAAVDDLLARDAEQSVPVYMRQSSLLGQEHGVLVLRGSVDDGITYRIRRDDGTTVGEAEILTLA